MKTRILLLSLLLLPLAVFAQKKPGEVVTIQGVEIKGDAKPGATVSAMVRVQVEKGHYTQSSKPSDQFFVATSLVAATNVPGVTMGAVGVPEGKVYEKKDLPKPLSIYEGDYTLTVPLTLASNASVPIEIPATLRYQACRGSECYPPRTLTFTIPVGVAR